MPFLRSIFCIAVAAVMAMPAASQTPPATPKHTCKKPGAYPGNLASDTQKRTWQKDYLAYADCLKKFVAEQQALADPYVKAGNDAIAEYNAAVAEYNEVVEKAKEANK
jgi:hypothetical protein